MVSSRGLWHALKFRPTIISAVAVAGAGTYYGTRSLLPSGHAESIEAPKVFGGFGPKTLRLQSVDQVNHNTKRLVFEFPDQSAKSGLTLTCKFSFTNGYFTNLLKFKQLPFLHSRGHKADGFQSFVHTHL